MRRLPCWIGRHRWERRIEHGEEFSVCSLCGKERGGSSGGDGGAGAERDHIWGRTEGAAGP